jgi:hypothetical protein
MEVLLGEAVDGREAVDAGVVDQDVDLAVGLLGFGEEALDLGDFGDIALHSDGLSTFRGDVGDNLIRALAAGCIVDDDFGAGGSKVAGNLCADALGRAGDDGDLPLKLAHGVLLLNSTIR